LELREHFGLVVTGKTLNDISENQPFDFPRSIKPGLCSGLILSGAFHPVLKDGVWRRRSIKRLRVKKKLTQETLAYLSGISHNTIVKIENDATKTPAVKT
jgi:hypothetical protein